MVIKSFFYLFISVLLVGTVTAQETLTEQIPSFQYNTQFDLKRGCFDNGFFCDSNFVCNITIVSPDGNTLMVDNQLMTNQGSYRNVTIPQTSNTELGFAEAIQSCNNVSVAGRDNFIIAITGDGDPWRAFPYQFYVGLLAIAMIVIGAFKERLRIFKHLGSMLMMGIGVITLYPGYSFINYSTLIGQSLGTIFIGLGFYFLIEDSFSRDVQQENYDSRPVVISEGGEN